MRQSASRIMPRLIADFRALGLACVVFERLAVVAGLFRVRASITLLHRLPVSLWPLPLDQHPRRLLVVKGVLPLVAYHSPPIARL